MTGKARAIARPSERRSEGLVIVHDDTPELIEVDEPGRLRSGMTAVGFLGVMGAAIAFGVLGILGIEPTVAGLVVVPVISVAVHQLVRSTAGRVLGAEAVAIAFAGLGARMLSAVPRLMGGVDAPVYHREGARVAESLRAFDLLVDTGRSIPGTGSVRYFAGVVNVFTGSTYIATYTVFVALAWIGAVLFLVGMRPALGDRQFRVLALVVMFSPTLAFWPSSIGKESMVLFGIGVTVAGASIVIERRLVGVTALVAGVLVVGLVRPHVGLVLLSAVVVGLFTRRTNQRSRVLANALAITCLMAGAMWFSTASASLFGLEGLDGFSDVSAALEFAQQRTSQDAAVFVAPRVESPVDYPWAVITVLFRPFVWEAPNVLALLTAVEATVLAALLAAAVPGLVRDRRRFVERGQALQALAFVAIFTFVFSAIGNFGILSRQRAQVIPFVLVIVAIGIGAERSRVIGAERSRVIGAERSRVIGAERSRVIGAERSRVIGAERSRVIGAERSRR